MVAVMQGDNPEEAAGMVVGLEVVGNLQQQVETVVALVADNLKKYTQSECVCAGVHAMCVCGVCI